MTVTIEVYDRINFTPAFLPLASAWVELMKKNGTELAVLLRDDTRAITAVVSDEVVGVLAWELRVERREAYLLLAWVAPSHRKQGVLVAMYKALEFEARRFGLHHIAYDTNNPSEQERDNAIFLIRDIL